MNTRTFATIFGVIFLLVGIAGFIPGMNHMHTMQPEDTHLSVHGPGTGHLLGLFHVNVLHNVVHVLFGVLGLAAGRSYSATRGYFTLVAVAYALLAVLGLIPTANIQYTFGLIPIEGNDVWLHALLAAGGALFAFLTPRRGDAVTVTDTTGTAGPAV